jgi:hypothetical protein
MNEEATEHGMQIRCRDCKTGWVTVNSQDEAPSADSGSTCLTCSTFTVPEPPYARWELSTVPPRPIIYFNRVGLEPDLPSLRCPALLSSKVPSSILRNLLFLDAKIAKGHAIRYSDVLFISSPVFFFLLFSSLHHCIDSVHLSSRLEGETFVFPSFPSFLLASSFSRVVSFLPRVISSFPRVLFLTSSLSLHLCLPKDLASHRCTESPSFSYVMPTRTVCCHVAHPPSLMRENSRCTHCGQSFPMTSFRYDTLPCDILPYDTLPCHCYGA